MQGALKSMLDNNSVCITNSENAEVGYRVRRTRRPDPRYFARPVENASPPGGELRDLLDTRRRLLFAVPQFQKRQPSDQWGSLPPLPPVRDGAPPVLRPCRDTRCPPRLRHG